METKLKKESFFFFPLQRSEKEENEEIDSPVFFEREEVTSMEKEKPES